MSKEPRDRRSHDSGIKSTAATPPVGAAPTALTGDALAFPRDLRRLGCNFSFSTSSPGRECQSHQAVRRLTELCTQVYWHFFSYQVRMREPGTDRTSAITQIGGVQITTRIVQIRISQKAFLVPACTESTRDRVQQSALHPAQYTTDPRKDAARHQLFLTPHPPGHTRTCAASALHAPLGAVP